MSENEPASDARADEAQSQCLDDEVKLTARRQMRLVVRRIVVAAVLILIAWGLYSGRGYWQSAWKDRTLWPTTTAGREAADSEQLRTFQAPRQSPFDLSSATVPVREVLSGGPPKDGIPALTDPRLIEAGEATYLQADDRLIGLVAGSEARAYPLKILDYHEIINDRIGNVPVAVTYCPLCDSCAVFDRRTELGQRDFGVSGLLYNSNVLMYDRGGNPESLWSQVMTQGISGPAARKPLTALPLELTIWKDWQSRHPETKVLSTDTGHHRDYSRSPYADYFVTPQLMFPAKPTSDRLPTKARVLGVWIGTVARAYPESAFGRDRLRVEDALNGRRIVVEFNPEFRSLRVVEADDGLHWMYSLWFAWYAMRPGTEVFSP